MHVAELWTCTAAGAPSDYFVRPEDPYWKVKIVDANGAAVSGASVTTNVYKPNGSLWVTKTGTTGADGYVTLTANILNNSPLGTYRITVTGVTKSGWTYNAAANVISEDTFNVQ